MRYSQHCYLQRVLIAAFIAITYSSTYSSNLQQHLQQLLIATFIAVTYTSTYSCYLQQHCLSSYLQQDFLQQLLIAAITYNSIAHSHYLWQQLLLMALPLVVTYLKQHLQQLLIAAITSSSTASSSYLQQHYLQQVFIAAFIAITYSSTVSSRYLQYGTNHPKLKQSTCVTCV